MTDYPEPLFPLVDELKATLLRAFETGRATGLVEGEANLRKELESILNRNSVPVAPVEREPIPSVTTDSGGPRAPKGSVRPAIISVLEAIDPGYGATPNEILMGVHSLGQTLIKAETIRTTLHKMMSEGLVSKVGDRWSLKRIEGSEAVTTEPS